VMAEEEERILSCWLDWPRGKAEGDE
jgi:hypothetical protein